MAVAVAPVGGLLEPFSLGHFLQWVDQCELTLDSGEDWVIEPFQEEILADVLGPVREVWTILPEGNAKTTLLSAVALYAGDHAPAPWIPIGAASRDQAEIMFGQAAGFVERSAELKRRFRVFEGYRKIKCLRTGGRGIKVYPWDPRTGDGVIPFPMAFTDELHRHEDLRLYRLWKGKLLKRGGRIRAISTAGEPGAEFEEMREKIRNNATERERDGCHLRAVGANIVYHEWMVPALEHARDLAMVKDANPLSSITLEDLEGKLNSDTLDFGEDWARLTCNIPTRSSQAAIPEADWDALQVADEIPAGERVSLGVDVAWQQDTFAIVPLWVRADGSRLFGEPEILTPPRDGTMLSLDDVKNAFHRMTDRFQVEVVVMDTTRAQDVAQWLGDDLGLTVVDRTQGNDDHVADYNAWMNGMRDKTLHHGGHREFRRHVLNAVSRAISGDKRRFDRPSSSRNTRAGRQERRVIDGLTAAAMVNSHVAAFVSGPLSEAW